MFDVSFGCLVTRQHSTAGASPNLYNLLPLLFRLVRTKESRHSSV